MATAGRNSKVVVKGIFIHLEDMLACTGDCQVNLLTKALWSSTIAIVTIPYLLGWTVPLLYGNKVTNLTAHMHWSTILSSFCGVICASSIKLIICKSKQEFLSCHPFVSENAKDLSDCVMKRRLWVGYLTWRVYQDFAMFKEQTAKGQIAAYWHATFIAIFADTVKTKTVMHVHVYHLNPY